MPSYMTQTMSSGTLPVKRYYRAQTNDHPSHAESGAFTQAAMNNYAAFNHIPVNQVVAGSYASNQGIPTGPNTYQI